KPLFIVGFQGVDFARIHGGKSGAQLALDNVVVATRDPLSALYEQGVKSAGIVSFLVGTVEQSESLVELSAAHLTLEFVLEADVVFLFVCDFEGVSVLPAVQTLERCVDRLFVCSAVDEAVSFGGRADHINGSINDFLIGLGRRLLIGWRIWFV